ncbi:MAG: hypothetical protein Q8Q62_21555 [Mesorhizobium sp.]|nr:hypothetical protein [Mesorhizobium sp.]
MRDTRHSLKQTLRMLPRLVVLSLLVGLPVLSVGASGAAWDSGRSGVILVGGDLATPNGMGFVLAMGLQRTQ